MRTFTLKKIAKKVENPGDNLTGYFYFLRGIVDY